ncbi:MAG: primosomal protein N' [Clostridium sp.]|nr:primosomal protein N' [Clostridium sp.]
MSAKYVDIIIDISHEAIDRAFQYEVPFSLCDKIAVGMQVEIPFGRGNHMRTGYVIGISDEPNYDVDRIKPVHRIIENQIPVEGQLIRLAAWMKETYGSTMYQALKTVMPVKETVRPVEKKTVQLAVDAEEGRLRLLEYQRKHNGAKVRLTEALLEHGTIPYELARNKLNISPATFERLTAEGTIEILTETQYRQAGTKRYLTEPEPELNPAQQGLIDAFRQDYEAGHYQTYLLHGVTGSGKTEVYMHAMDVVLAQGRQVIMLIPEISLTFQTVMRFRRHFGERITILNSRMSKGERYDQFERIRKGEVDIVIGPRSALFAPFSNLGLIVIDEEHESSYKSDNIPKYHARETAIKRADMNHASVILGSATPSVSSYYQAEQGNYRLWKLTERVQKRSLPKVEIVDLREELQKGNRSRFSYRLQELIEDRLGRKEQSIIFMNRRGYASFVSCRSCGEVVNCPHCQVSLTYHDHHSAVPKLVCHYCGYTEPFIKKCKVCGSGMIGRFGSGTQMVEAELQEFFPEARILRMDADTTKGKDGHERILSAFAEGKADILVGTQMIVKGHDFPNVTLVGILAADLSLHSQDYMAGERTFELLTQAAGRAGRGERPGQVVIQTYDPEHAVIRAAAAQDYELFYRNEITYRKILKYPPVVSMIAVLITGEQEEQVQKCAERLADYMRTTVPGEVIRVIGPSTPVIGKIHDVYRRILYLKSEQEQALLDAKVQLELYAEQSGVQEACRLYFDLNPMKGY